MAENRINKARYWWAEYDSRRVAVAEDAAYGVTAAGVYVC